MRAIQFVSFLITAVLLSTHVHAEDEDMATPSPSSSEEIASPASTSLKQVDPGSRFRWGIAGGGGFESVSPVSGPMFGLDVRLGWQMNDLIAVYAQPHLSFGALSTSGGGAGVSGATGTFAISAMGEVTLMDRLFLAAGGGYGVLNNPSGAMFHARVGGYPWMEREDDGDRAGLMLGMDVRTIFITGATGVLVMGSIGYEVY